jgi:hypothetical protein
LISKVDGAWSRVIKGSDREVGGFMRNRWMPGISEGG